MKKTKKLLKKEECIVDYYYNPQCIGCGEGWCGEGCG